MKQLSKKIVFITAYSFIFLYLVSIALITYSSIKQRNQVVAANTSHSIVPIIFYPRDVAPPGQNYIDAVNNSMTSVRSWYAQQGGEQFNVDSARIYTGENTRDYYLNSDFWQCGVSRVMCNIEMELALHEKNTWKGFGVQDIGLGMSNKDLHIFLKDIPDFYQGGNLGTTQSPWAASAQINNGGARAYYSQVTLDTLVGNTGVCNDYVSRFPITTGMCTVNAQRGVIAHEMGHTLGISWDYPSTQEKCALFGVNDPTECQNQIDQCLGSNNVMCYKWINFPNNTLSPNQINNYRNSPFSNPPEIGTFTPTFCWLSDNPSEWCGGSTSVGGIPSPNLENLPSQNSTDGGSVSYIVSWPSISYRHQVCLTLYDGSVHCQPFKTTNSNKATWDLVSGVNYDLHVDVSSNGSDWYGWESQSNKSCTGGSMCSLEFTWANVDYKVKTTLDGGIEHVVTHPAVNYTYQNAPAGSDYSGTVEFNDFDNFGTRRIHKSLSGRTPALLIKPERPRLTGVLGLPSCVNVGQKYTNISLGWTAVSGATSYRVRLTRDTATNGDYSLKTVTTNIAGSAGGWDSGGNPRVIWVLNGNLTLDPSARYFYTVEAINSAGSSGFDLIGNNVSFGPISPCNVLIPPKVTGISNLPACLETGQKFGINLVFNWTSVTGATGYTARITKDVNTGGDYALKSSTTNSTRGLGGWDSSGNPRVVWVKGGSLYFDTNVKYFIAVEATNGSVRSGYDLTSKSLSFGPVPICPDTDKDGFSDKVEDYMGTDKNKACGANDWPPDLNNDRYVNAGDQAMLSSHVSSRLGSTNYDKRFDLNGDTAINSGDQAILSKFVGKSCV